MKFFKNKNNNNQNEPNQLRTTQQTSHLQMLDSEQKLQFVKSLDGSSAFKQNFKWDYETKAKLRRKSKKCLQNKIPISKWIGQYNLSWGINDLIAGITLGLTMIPECIACALLAGLPARYGLCSAFVGPFVYLVFGSINKVIIGPTSLVALVSVQFTVGKPLEFAFLLTFFAGIMQLIMGTLKLGFIFEFISMPVIKAFSSATAIVVIESQIKVLLGIKYLAQNLPESESLLWQNIAKVNYSDLIMGVSAIVFLISFELVQKLAEHPKIPKHLSVFMRYLGFARTIMVVLITGAISFIWIEGSEERKVPFTLSKNTAAGLPNFTVPNLGGVQAETTFYSIWDILSELNIGIVVIPVIGVLTNISIGKLTLKGLVDINQELLTNGICNVLGSCVQSMPTSGAFSRCAISSACGLQTPMANLYSGIIALLALSYLSPYFKYIPEATLAAILICSLYSLLDFRLPLRLWRECKKDLVIWIICFIVCVLRGVEVGLIVSILLTAGNLLYLHARPEVQVKLEELDEIQYISITPCNGIYYPAASFLREKVLKACSKADLGAAVVIDASKVTGLDYTAAQGLTKLSADISPQNAVSKTMLVIYQMRAEFHKFIDPAENLMFCDSIENLKELLTVNASEHGILNMKEQLGTSIDLGYRL